MRGGDEGGGGGGRCMRAQVCITPMELDASQAITRSPARDSPNHQYSFIKSYSCKVEHGRKHRLGGMM